MFTAFSRRFYLLVLLFLILTACSQTQSQKNVSQPDEIIESTVDEAESPPTPDLPPAPFVARDQSVLPVPRSVVEDDKAVEQNPALSDSPIGNSEQLAPDTNTDINADDVLITEGETQPQSDEPTPVAGSDAAVIEEPALPPSPEDEDLIVSAVTDAVRTELELSSEADMFVSNIETTNDWAFGTIGMMVGEGEHQEPLGLLFIAHKNDGWLIAVENTDLFDEWLIDLPTALVSNDTKLLLGATLPDGQVFAAAAYPNLSLPYAGGETWTLSGGPHPNSSAQGGVWSSLDFAGGSGNVKASASGTAWRPCTNFVRVDHAGGWQTGYYHVSNISVANGSSVSQGQQIGTTSSNSGCGGSATGPHVHFTLRKGGTHQGWNNFDLGGWTVTNGATPYTGCMRRISDNVLRCQWQNIYNSSTIGTGTPGTIEKARLLWNITHSGVVSSARKEYWPIQLDLTRNIRIEVKTTSGDLVTRVKLRSGGFNGTSVVTSVTGNGSVTIIDRIQGAGQYNILVEAVSGSGTYTIVARKVDTYERSTMVWDTVYSGSASATRAERWNFWFSATRDFYLTANRTSGNLQPRIRLQNSSGAQIGYVNASTGKAVFDGTKPAGTYYAVVEPVGVTSGNYTLTIKQGSGSNPPPPPPPSADIEITHVEITQATQNASNTVPLIAGKPTFVRVYVRCLSGCPKYNVTGVIEVQSSNSGMSTIPVHGTITAYNTTNWAGQRGSRNYTLNFNIPASVSHGNLSLTAKARSAQTTATYSISRSFNNTNSIDIVYIPIIYGGWRYPNTTTMRLGSQYAEEVFPVDNIDYHPYGIPTFWGANDTNDTMLTKLTWFYYLYTYLGNDADFIYGWLPSNSTNEGGKADASWAGGAGKAALSEMFGSTTSAQRVFTHEIAHLLGSRHLNLGCGDQDPNTDWPFGNSLIQEFGLDGRIWQIKNATSISDYMSYCSINDTSGVWTSAWRYEQLYNTRFSTSASLSDQRIVIAAESVIESLVITGLINDDMSIELDPLWFMDGDLTSANPPLGTEYCLEAQDVGGSMISSRCFDASFIDIETGQATDFSMFFITLPASPSITQVVLKDAGGTVLGGMARSLNAPEVRIISPNGGELWDTDTPQTVQWVGTDPDGDILTYHVLYSNDGGATWMPVDISSTDTSIILDTSRLRGGNSAKIKIIASDGFNVASDISDINFAVEKKSPEVTIKDPVDGLVVSEGFPIWLSASAYDPENGFITGTDVTWTSDKDGNLGSGEDWMVNLSPGWHTITLSATDSDGNTTTDTVTVFSGDSSAVKTSEWDFAAAQDSVGWTAGGRTLTDLGFDVDGWNFTIDDTIDPMLVSPTLNIDTSTYRYVTVVMDIDLAVACNAHLYFNRTGEGFAEARRVALPLQSGMQTYTFDMWGNANWSGMLEELRLDTVHCGLSPPPGTGTVSIKSIALSSSTVWDFAAEQAAHGWTAGGLTFQEVGFDGGGWQLNVNDTIAPFITSPSIDLGGADYRYAAVTMQIDVPSNCNTHLYFGKFGEGFSEDRRLASPIESGVMKTIYLDLSENNHWASTLVDLRLDVIHCGTSDGQTGTVTIQKIEMLEDVILASPSLLSPSNGENAGSEILTFEWGSVPLGMDYRIQIDNDQDFTSPAQLFETEGLTYDNLPLVTGKYYWRVQAINSRGTGGAWSSVQTFKVDRTLKSAPIDTVTITTDGNVPAKVTVIIDGVLAYKCIRLTPVEQIREGNIVWISFSQKTPSNKTCSATEKPYSLTVELDGVFGSGTYTVFINDEEYTFTIP